MKTLIKVEHLHLGYDNQEVINDLSFDAPARYGS